MDTSKIIRGVVSNGRYTVTAPIVKEDYGLYLKIEGLELPSTYEVDFSNSENNGTSVTMIGNADGVLIPRQFIDSGKDVFAFLYHVGEDFGRTVYKFRIPNKARPDRTDEQPTPEEQSTIDQCISALNEAVAQTAQDVIDADASAQSASADAERAEEARTDAQNYATQAEQSATDAQESASQASASATASANSASASAQIKADVEDLVDDAQTSASASAQSASASANSASQAQGFAQSASASAQSASGYASQAGGYAQTASAKAQDASTSASTASQKATESAQSASQALSYKTDAESAKTASQTAQGLAESARDTAVSAKTDAESARDDAESARDEAQSAVASISGALADKAPVITDTASGAIASFSDGADNLPLKSLIVNIDPVQDLSHGDPSPENICPISGRDSVTVTRTGKNIIKLSQDNEVRKNGGSLFTLDYLGDNTVRMNTTIVAACYVIWEVFEVTKNLVGKSFTLSCDENVNIYWYKTANKDGSWTTPPISFPSNIRTVKITEDDIGRAFGIGFYNESGTAKTITHVQVEIGTATAFEPYKEPQTVTIQLGQTVYGGKLDVLSGELTVYPYYASYNGETLTGEWISDRDKYVAGTTPTIGAQVVDMSGTGTEVQLTPHQIRSLYGNNTIFADTGDSEVEYRADTKAWVQRKIAEAISALS